MPPIDQLGRRERQIIEVIIRRGRATASEVLADIADPPTYSTIRTMLRHLESKGYVAHEWEGPRYVYRPTTTLSDFQHEAARDLLKTFFHNSIDTAVAALLGAAEKPPTNEELDRAAATIEAARKRRRRK